MSRLMLLAILLSSNVMDASWAEEWGQFRGPRGTGLSSNLALPDQLTPEHIAWHVEIGNGTSSPVFSKDLMFASGWQGRARHLFCFKAADGKLVWKQALEQVRQEAFTPPNSPATCTPVCDDKHVAVLFPDTGLAVYTHEGRQLWKKDLGPFSSMHGISASPLLEDGRLVVTIDQLQDAYIVALDVTSGQELWRTDRLIGVTGGYSSPTIAELDGEKVIISAAPGEMVAYNLKTGAKLMSVLGLTNAPVSVPVVIGQRIYYTEPPGKPLPMSALGNADKNGDEVIEVAEVKDSVGVLRLIERLDKGFGNGDGKVDLEEWNKGFGTFVSKGGLSCVEMTKQTGAIEGRVSWKYTKTTPYIPSVVVKDDLLYIINDGGVMICIDASSGSQLSRQRLSGATGQYYASPVIAGERMVIANMDGKVSLLTTGKDFRLLSTLDLEDPIVATPAIHAGRLYIRTSDRITCLSPQPLE